METEYMLALRTRIDQNLRFFDSLDRIRWQFTAAFGAGATAAIVLALDDKISAKKEGILLVLVFGLSLAGLVAQIRIFALISVIWERMLVLQAKEFELLQEVIHDEGKVLRMALFFPRLGVLDSLIFRILSVAMASCFLFSLLIGIGAYLGTAAMWQSHVRPITSGVAVTLLFMTLSLVGGKRYALAVESSVVQS